jgi:hypothetical protein
VHILRRSFGVGLFEGDEMKDLKCKVLSDSVCSFGVPVYCHDEEMLISIEKALKLLQNRKGLEACMEHYYKLVKNELEELEKSKQTKPNG